MQKERRNNGIMEVKRRMVFFTHFCSSRGDRHGHTYFHSVRSIRCKYEIWCCLSSGSRGLMGIWKKRCRIKQSTKNIIWVRKRESMILTRWDEKDIRIGKLYENRHWEVLKKTSERINHINWLFKFWAPWNRHFDNFRISIILECFYDNSNK